MADINAVDLTAETLSSLDGTENVVGFDTAEGKKIPISVLADYAIQSKTQTLAGSTQTPKAAIDVVANSFQYFTDTNSASDGSTEEQRYKASITRILTNFAATSPAINKTYNVMMNIGGATSGMFVGIVNVTNTSMRFFVSYNQYNYSGTFVRSSLEIPNWQNLPTRAEMNAVNARGNALRFTISNESTDVIDTNYINPIIVSQGSVATTYGAYFVVLRIDSAADGASCYIVRHNSAGYQISKIYEGTASNTPVITSDGVVKLLSSSNSVTVHGYYLKLAGWS